MLSLLIEVEGRILEDILAFRPEKMLPACRPR